MDLFASLAMGLQVAVTPINLLYCLMGVTLGTAIGVLPGVGPIITISLLLPLTFGLTPEASIIMLAGISMGRPMAARPPQSSSTCPARPRPP